MWLWCVFITFCRIEKENDFLLSSKLFELASSDLPAFIIWAILMFKLTLVGRICTIWYFCWNFMLTYLCLRSLNAWTCSNLISALPDLILCLSCLQLDGETKCYVPCLCYWTIHISCGWTRNFINYSCDVLVGECFCKWRVFCFFNFLFGLKHCHSVVQFFVVYVWQIRTPLCSHTIFVITWSITELEGIEL